MNRLHTMITSAGFCDIKDIGEEEGARINNVRFFSNFEWKVVGFSLPSHWMQRRFQAQIKWKGRASGVKSVPSCSADWYSAEATPCRKQHIIAYVALLFRNIKYGSSF